MMLCEYRKLIFRLRWLHNWFQMQTFRPLLDPTPSFPLARLPNHKSEHLEHLRNKVIKINVRPLYEVYSPESAIWLKSYSSFLCYMIIYFSIHLLSVNLALESSPNSDWRCRVTVSMLGYRNPVRLSFFSVLELFCTARYVVKKVVIDRCYLWASLFSLQASSLTFHIAPAWAVLWFICNCDILTEERREERRKKKKSWLIEAGMPVKFCSFSALNDGEGKGGSGGGGCGWGVNPPTVKMHTNLTAHGALTVTTAVHFTLCEAQ